MDQLPNTDPRDRINQSTYGSSRALRMYEYLDGYTDPGEQAALERVAAEAHGQPILDLGVGVGRTVPLLRGISTNYTAVDYTPAAVEACRARHPGVDVRVGDARDLSAFGDASFFLVVFSFNGIDSVSHEDRRTILREIYRVLVDGGVCLFSAHNFDGPVQRRGGRYQAPQFHFTPNPLKLGVRGLRHLFHVGLSLRNRRRNGSLEFGNSEYCIANSAAHEYGLMIHHIRLGLQKRQLQQIGFSEIEALSCVDGQPVTDHDDTSAVTWFHFLARKPIS